MPKLSTNQPQLMGILNITPDSFFDGGVNDSIPSALARVKLMIDEGMHILDIGAQSTRPGATIISAEEECQRLLPVLKEIRAEYPDIVISVDTFYGKVADQALEVGVDVINDVTAGTMDDSIIDVVSQSDAVYVYSHIKGNLSDIKQPQQYHDLPSEIKSYFEKGMDDLQNRGVKNIWIDPGFGFGKDIDQNFEVLKNLNILTDLGVPLLVGLSRKSMIWRTLEISAKEALNGSTALHMYALQNGANILRVHDIREANETIKLSLALQ